MQIMRLQKEFVKICRMRTYLITLEICLEIQKLDPTNFFSAPGLAWQGA